MTARVPPGGPDWVRETIAVTRDEISRFLATAVRFCVQPMRFGAGWVAGSFRALNPLGFMATALAVNGVALALIGAVVGGSDPQGLASQVAMVLLPYAYYLVLGVCAHPLLRITGSTRPLRSTFAIALFAGGGPGLLLTIAILVLGVVRVAAFGGFDLATGFSHGLPLAVRLTIAIVVLGLYLYFVATLALGLAGAHGVGRVRALGAIVVALIVTGLVIGITGVEPPVPVLAIFPRHWPPDVGVFL